MGLLAPLFLLGLAAIAVPLLMHLVHREKREPTAFPSLMLLERTPAPFTARRHLRDPLLFLLRALAVAALALAFARPVLGRARALLGGDAQQREIVVLLDRSFSMRLPGRWSRAMAATDSIIGSMARGDRLTLVAFARRAEALVSATEASVLRSALQGLSPSDDGTRFAPAVALARELAEKSEAPRKVVVVLSDFQRSGWDLSAESRLPAGVAVHPIDVSGAASVSDRAVRAVTVRAVKGSGEGSTRAIVAARLSNVGPAVRQIGVRLEVSGRVVQQRVVDIARDGATAVEFDAIPLPPDAVPARVVLANDSVSGDDAYHFRLQAAPPLRVLAIEGRPSPFVSRALALNDDPRIEVLVRRAEGATAADLVGRRVVILVDGAFPRGLGGDRLVQFVREGGGLIAALGEQASARTWPSAARALVPGGVGERRSGTMALGTMDASHPAVGEIGSGALLATRFAATRAIDTTGGVVARFADGRAALVEHALGAGRVVTMGMGLDGTWSDLPTQPLFLPFVVNLTRYAAAWRAAPVAEAIGARVRPSDIAGTGASAVGQWAVESPSGERSIVGGANAPAALELTEAGVYAMRPRGVPGARARLVAANVPSAELDFATMDPSRLVTAVLGDASRDAAPATPPAEPTPAEREARQSAWWYVLLAVLLLLLAESVVARRAPAPSRVGV